MIHKLLSPMALLALAVSYSQPASAKQANVADRQLLSIAVANYIRDGASRRFNGGRSIEIGAAAIDGRGALADWRSQSGNTHGQIAFFYLCDQWTVLDVRHGAPFRFNELTGRASYNEIGAATAKKLVAELATLERGKIEFLPPARPEASC